MVSFGPTLKHYEPLLPGMPLESPDAHQAARILKTNFKPKSSLLPG